MKWLALFVALTVFARADTVILTSKASINGVVRFQNGWFTVEGRAGGKPWTSDPISAQAVEEVKFNALDYNSLPLPVAPAPRAPLAEECDILLKRGRSLKKGTLVALDQMIRLENVKPLDRKRFSGMWILAIRDPRYTPTFGIRR